MQDSIGIPVWFSSSSKRVPAECPISIIKSGQSVLMSIYRTKIAGQCRLITITWCKNLLFYGLSVTVKGMDGGENYKCKVEVKPWNFWKKQGSKQFVVDGRIVGVVWDLKAAKFHGGTEPKSDYYVAIVSGGEVVLVVGDQKKDAFRRTGCRPALIEPMLVSREEHVSGKNKFSTRARFEEKGKFHELSIECKKGMINNTTPSGGFDPEMEIKIDGNPAVHVKHLQWKFRGNQPIFGKEIKLEVYWDVYDWLFDSGPRHGLFIFKPVSSSASISSPPLLRNRSLSDYQEVNSEFGEEDYVASRFSLFLYVWKVD